MSPTTRKMSARHEDDLVAVLGGERTRNSGAVWSDQGDGNQSALSQHWRFGWDGKSTLGKSVSVTREMLSKLREQSRGLLPLLPLRFYANDRLTEVSEDWVALELDAFAQMQDDANRFRWLVAALDAADVKIVDIDNHTSRRQVNGSDTEAIVEVTTEPRVTHAGAAKQPLVSILIAGELARMSVVVVDGQVRAMDGGDHE